MYSHIKVVSVLSCGVLLCLGLSQAAYAGQADEEGASRLAQAKVDDKNNALTIRSLP